VTDKVTDLLFTLVNIHYRKMNLISMNDIKSSKIATVFFNEIIPIIDRFIDSDEKAGIVAREIIDIFNTIEPFPKPLFKRRNTEASAKRRGR
jgi:hypothetical protein